MNTITIVLQEQNGQTAVHHIVGGEIPPAVAASACRFTAAQFDQLAIEAEVQRRLDELREEEADVKEGL